MQHHADRSNEEIGKREMCQKDLKGMQIKCRNLVRHDLKSEEETTVSE